jgi:uncharacterized membrane protein
MPSNIAFLALVLLVVSSIFKLFPPKKINKIYGYKTPRSMKNQNIWNEANKFSSNLMFGSSILFIIFVFITSNFIGGSLLRNISVFFLLVSLMFVIILTEIKLKKLYDKEGK